MRKLNRYFEVLFTNKEISPEELRNFAEDHLARLKSHQASGPNAGGFQELIAATQPLYDAFKTAVGEREMQSAQLGGGTFTKNQAMEAFIAKVRQREGKIRDAFGKQSAQYLEFFPRGLSEYAEARVGSTEDLMNRMCALGQKYEAQLV